MRSPTRTVLIRLVAGAASVALLGLMVGEAAAKPDGQATGRTLAAVRAHHAKRTAKVTDVVDLTIVTPEQTGKAGYPSYVPNDITLPAHSTVEVRIIDFDDATPQKPALFAKVEGTVGGTISVQAMNPADPNALGAAKTYKALDAKDDVGHTFTSPALHLNVPVAPHAVTSFLLKTGAPGQYHWQCMNPCGSGPNGMGGPMSTPGYMSGTITVG